MKIKLDFVTNSSCASFVIHTSNITNLQKFLIENHYEFAKRFHPPSCDYTSESSGWSIFIDEDEGKIEGDTTMDNFDMLWFLKEIGIDDDNIEYEGCY